MLIKKNPKIKFLIYKIVRTPTSSIKGFNTKVITKPCKWEEYSGWFGEASYSDKIILH